MQALLYDVKDRPPVGKTIVFALQQLLAILAGTITLPLIVGNGMNQAAALFGAGIGTIIYLLITKFRSPAFLGSSFTFIGAMTAAFAGATTASIGFVGVVIGAILSGLVYVILSIIVRFTGTNWVEKLMPPVIVGPVVALIGLTLAPNAISNLMQGGVIVEGDFVANPYICLACGLITFVIAIVVAVYGKKLIKLIPFIIAIIGGYLIAGVLSWIGFANNISALQIIDFRPFTNITWHPSFAFLEMFKGFKEFKDAGDFFTYFGFIAISYVPVSFAVFAEHIADHKNISFIIDRNLLEDPGLSRTLMGDGVGSIVGAFFGGCPNTTYGESISCLAFSRNASVITILVASIMAVVLSFFGPLMTFFATIPPCIIGGLSLALYGFIALSGLRMMKDVDLTDIRNFFTIATILVFGIGGLVLGFKYFTIPAIACAFVGGLLVNALTHINFKKKKSVEIDDKNTDTIEEK